MVQQERLPHGGKTMPIPDVALYSGLGNSRRWGSYQARAWADKGGRAEGDVAVRREDADAFFQRPARDVKHDGSQLHDAGTGGQPFLTGLGRGRRR